MRKLNTPYCVALMLATIGAAVSLYGLVSMFGLAFAPIGLGLEIGKLTAAAALHKYWHTIGWRLRYSLASLVIILMGLTTTGIYGFTLTQYLAHVAAITSPAAERVAGADEDVRRQAVKVADLTAQIAAIDASQPAATGSMRRENSRAKTAAAINAQASADAAAAKLQAAEDQRRQVKRDTLVLRRDAEAAELSRLRGMRETAGSQQQSAEAEVGPVKAVADLLGIDPGKILATVVSVVFDPLCVLMLFAGAVIAGARNATHPEPVAEAPAARPETSSAPMEIKAPKKRRTRSKTSKARKPRGESSRKRKPALAPDWRKPDAAISDYSNVHYLVRR